MRRGISPILASVIIIAVTLVIAIGVIGWVMGVWNIFGSTEALKVYPDSYMKLSGNKRALVIVLHVKNEGSKFCNITKVEISLQGCNVFIPRRQLNKALLDPGEEQHLKAKARLRGGCIYTSGALYQVTIYTQEGNVYKTTVRAT